MGPDPDSRVDFIKIKASIVMAPNNGIKAYLILNAINVMPDTKKKINTTKDDYDKALASDDPTKISASDLENLAKEAMKKFKSL